MENDKSNRSDNPAPLAKNFLILSPKDLSSVVVTIINIIKMIFYLQLLSVIDLSLLKCL